MEDKIAAMIEPTTIPGQLETNANNKLLNKAIRVVNDTAAVW